MDENKKAPEGEKKTSAYTATDELGRQFWKIADYLNGREHEPNAETREMIHTTIDLYGAGAYKSSC